MKISNWFAVFPLLFTTLGLPAAAPAADGRTVIDLSGEWEFEQTVDAFPPDEFSRTIPVPGLIFLARPKIEQYDRYYDGSYKPRYNWYRTEFDVPESLEGSNSVLTILKSKYVTHAYLNGTHLGGSMSCYTPIELRAERALNFGGRNELLVRVDDRKRLPAQAAGSTDKEKVTYWPGIWDEVFISFTGRQRIKSALVLPSVADSSVTVKALVRNFHPAQIEYGDPMTDFCALEVTVRESVSGRVVAGPATVRAQTKRDNLTVVELDVPLADFRAWTPEDPFLYTVEVGLRTAGDSLSDRVERKFGMRDFGRRGKHFTLNGEKYYLRGTNITLHRFFEDPACEGLPWDREWVTKLLADIPERTGWNAMRICVGIAPSFWYDIADEAGLLIQNEWLYWQNHGWNEQIEQEYTDWVWADGSHPSIVIWDAINENWDPYIGNVIIPKLKELDPTRIWDAGYMTGEHMTLDEMDEPHPYMVFDHLTGYSDDEGDRPYPLGDLHYWAHPRGEFIDRSSAQLVNEYGWVWLWRNGEPAHLTTGVYDYFLPGAGPRERREFQAYWVQLQTEWLRVERSIAGVLAFCYLTDNFGFTGDWFLEPVSELKPAPALDWFRHCFAPSAVFIDMVDLRYNKHREPLQPGSMLPVNLVGVNDMSEEAAGDIRLRLLDGAGRETASAELSTVIQPYHKSYETAVLRLPEAPGGYLLVCEFSPRGGGPVLSRRYLRVGETSDYEYPGLAP